MSYKTILLHLRDEKTAEQLLNTACRLARRYEAHLIGLHVLPPIVLPPPIEVPYGAELIAANKGAAAKTMAKLKDNFETTVANQPFVSEWRAVEAGASSVARTVCEQARAVDLTVLGQSVPNTAGQGDDTVEYTAFESGRPLFIVPSAGRFDKHCERIMIAWNGRKEAVRAVFDALPLLKGADKVHIVSVATGAASDLVDIPGAQIAAALARHGVSCETAQTVSGDISVGDVLLNFTADNGIDLIVMGCYGHSRLREFVFGGATRTILAQMTAPVLMSH